MKKTVIVGAGHLGTSIMRELKEIDLIEIVGICDNDPNAKGIKIAKELNVPIYSDIKQVCLLEDLDLIIDTTATGELGQALEEKNITVLNFHGTNLMITLFHNHTSDVISNLYNYSQSLNEALQELLDSIRNADMQLKIIGMLSQNSNLYLN